MKAVATVLSNNILFRAKKDHIPVTPMKLQKLLYYVCVKYVQDTGTTPIAEPFLVWKYGPVAPSVYAEFKSYGSKPIKSYDDLPALSTRSIFFAILPAAAYALSTSKSNSPS